jgi:two-component system, cell cycle sensor histidine kinase and response regulator CckA
MLKLTILGKMSNRKQSSPLLRAQPERLLQLVMDTIPEFIFWKDRNSVYVGCNQNFARAAGVGSPEGIVGKTDFDLAWKPEEAAFFREVDERVMSSGVAEYRIVEPQLHADGKCAWLETNKVPLLDDDGRVVGILGTFQDITERKSGEQALQERERSLRITLDSIADGVISTDADGLIVRVNPVASGLLQTAPEELIGRKLDDVYLAHRREERVARELFASIRRDRRPQGPAEVVLVRSTEREQALLETAAPIMDKEGAFQGVVIVLRDITAQRQLEARLRHAHKMDSVGQLAGGIAHDFNNMLTGIMGAAEMLRLGVTDSPRLTELADLILKTSARAGELTRRLLTFSRQDCVATGDVDIHDVVNQVVSILERSVDRRIEIDVQLQADPSHTQGNKAELESALLNLALNGRDAMPEGGQLSISTTSVELDESYCTAVPFTIEPGDFIRISVRDSGHGIPKDIQDRIFEPFFTTKPPSRGTGLGLATVYGTAVAHKGAVTVYSEPGVGTVFHVLLPIVGRGKRMDGNLPSQPCMRRGTVLVVDDEAVIRTTARLMLERMGFRVLLASDGLEGQLIYREHQQQIDVVIIDLVMPHVGGRECLRGIRSLNPDARVIVSSGFAQPEVLDALRAETSVVFLDKPYSKASLEKALHTACS